MNYNDKITAQKKMRQIEREIERIENLKYAISKKRPSTWSFEENKFMENIDEDIKKMERELWEIQQ